MSREIAFRAEAIFAIFCSNVKGKLNNRYKHTLSTTINEKKTF